jgi:RNA polymerase sigma-70 factor, ECF subfamily
MTHDAPRDLDPYARRLIRFKARQLARRAGFTASDREDLEQDLSHDLLARLRHFDPNRANRDAFTTQVVLNRVRTILIERDRKRRDWRRCRTSLQELVAGDAPDDGAIERAETLAEDACGRGIRSPASDERAELRLDLVAALQALPPDLRRVASALRTATPTDVSRALGVSRDTVYRAMRAIRVRFTELGIDVYAPADSSAANGVGTQEGAASAA